MTRKPIVADMGDVTGKEIEDGAKRLRETGFMQPSKPKSAGSKTPSKVIVAKGINAGKKVIVEKKVTKPKLDPAQAAQRKAALVAEAEEKRQREYREEQARLRAEHEAREEAYRLERERLKQAALHNPAAPFELRFAAAGDAGFKVVATRGPKDHPRRFVFKHPQSGERLTLMLPKGKLETRAAMRLTGLGGLPSHKSAQ